MSVTINVDMAKVNAMLDAVAGDIENAVRPASQAAAQVLYDEVRNNVARIGMKSGNLRRAVYQAFSKEHSDKGRATYHVSWNAKKAPHGHLVEYGYIQRYQVVLDRKGRWITLKTRPLASPRQVGARPFIRPAIAKFPVALEAAADELMRRINGITK